MSGVHLWESTLRGQNLSLVTVSSSLMPEERYCLEDGTKMEDGMTLGYLTLKSEYVLLHEYPMYPFWVKLHVTILHRRNKTQGGYETNLCIHLQFMHILFL